VDDSDDGIDNDESADDVAAETDALSGEIGDDNRNASRENDTFEATPEVVFELLDGSALTPSSATAPDLLDEAIQVAVEPELSPTTEAMIARAELAATRELGRIVADPRQTSLGELADEVADSPEAVSEAHGDAYEDYLLTIGKTGRA
jgi:hypothetical protein